MRRAPKLLIAAVVAALALAGCSRAPASCRGVIYVSALKDGTAKVNGKPVALENFGRTLENLKPSAKYIFYYRQDAGAAPAGKQWTEIRTILDAIMRLHLPVSLSTKPDFSDTVDGAGNSHPRQGCPG